jgi:hypothetical protein
MNGGALCPDAPPTEADQPQTRCTVSCATPVRADRPAARAYRPVVQKSAEWCMIQASTVHGELDMECAYTRKNRDLGRRSPWRLRRGLSQRDMVPTRQRLGMANMLLLEERLAKARSMTGRWNILALLFAVRTAMAFQFQSTAALAPMLRQEFGVGPAEIGLLIGLYLAPGVALAIPGGASVIAMEISRLSLPGLR